MHPILVWPGKSGKFGRVVDPSFLRVAGSLDPILVWLGRWIPFSSSCVAGSRFGLVDTTLKKRSACELLDRQAKDHWCTVSQEESVLGF